MFDPARALYPDCRPPPAGPPPDAPLPQSAIWARAARLMGADIAPLPADWLGPSGPGPAWQVPGRALHAGGRHRGFVVRRRWPGLGPVAMISRGPTDLDRPAEVAALRDRLGVRHLVIHAEDATAADVLAHAGFRRLARPPVIAELALGGSPEAMGAALHPKWRNRLRHALGSDLRVTRAPLPPDPRHWIFAAEAAQARARGYRPLPVRMVCALAAAAPGAAQIFTARHGGTAVAAIVVLRHGRVATYQIGWSRPEGRARSATNLLLWRAMLDLQAMGATRLDLGAADPLRAPGLARFKAGAGARLRPLGGSWIDTAWLAPRRHWPRLL